MRGGRAVRMTHLDEIDSALKQRNRMWSARLWSFHLPGSGESQGKHL